MMSMPKLTKLHQNAMAAMVFPSLEGEICEVEDLKALDVRLSSAERPSGLLMTLLQVGIRDGIKEWDTHSTHYRMITGYIIL